MNMFIFYFEINIYLKKGIIRLNGSSLNGCDANKRRKFAQEYDSHVAIETSMDSDFDDIPEVHFE